MKKLLIIEDEYGDKGGIADTCRKWPDELNIFTSSDEKQSIKIIEERNIDLIVCDLSSGYGLQVNNLSNLTYRFPYVPCLAIIGREQQLEENVLKLGVSACLESPLRPAELRLKVHELLQDATSGAVRGIPVHSLLQMFETDEKTCTLRIESKGKSGLVFLDRGTAVGAETGDQVNEDAFYSIVTWEDAVIEIKHYNCQRPQEIQQPLISLIMEAFRLKDERDSLTEKQQTENKPKLELKHFSTAGNRISLDMGAKIKIEVDEADSPLMSTLVGMIPNQYLVVTSPEPVDLAKKILRPDSRIVIKYLHMGRLCMFKTHLIESIESPHQLLFLAYPPVIHFHELRRAKRTTIFVPSTLKHNGKRELAGVLIDLSSMGCLYMAKVRGNGPLPIFDIDSNVELCCLLPGIKESQVLRGTVKNIKKTTSEIRVGIEFIGLDSELEHAIEKYVETVESISQ